MDDYAAPDITPHALTEADAAIYLSVSRSLLRQQRMSGDRDGRAPAIPYVRAGRMIRYRRVDLDEYLARYLVIPPATLDDDRLP